MGHAPAEPKGMADDVEDRDLPFDPDLDTAEDRRHRPTAAAGPFAARRRSRWPRIHWLTVAVVAGGGFLGGLARYLVGLALPTMPGAFPWAVFLVNTAGAFILALLLILVLEALPPTTYLRPLVGTGFCGALTTFSTMHLEMLRMPAGLAIAYASASIALGFAAVFVTTHLARWSG